MALSSPWFEEGRVGESIGGGAFVSCNTSSPWGGRVLISVVQNFGVAAGMHEVILVVK